MTIPLIVALAREEERPWLRQSLYALTSLTAIATAFTYFREALLELTMIVAVMFIKCAKAKVLILLFIIFFAYLAIDPVPEKLHKRAEPIQSSEEDGAAMQPIRAWRVASNIALDRPLVSGGFNFEESPNWARWWSYVAEQHLEIYGSTTHVAHSTYFQMLGQHGFVGPSLFLALLFSVPRVLRQIKDYSSTRRDLDWLADYALAIRTSIFGYPISGAFLNAAFFDLLYVYVGTTALLYKEMEPDLKTVPAGSPRTQATPRQPSLSAQSAPLESEPSSEPSPRSETMQSSVINRK